MRVLIRLHLFTTQQQARRGHGLSYDTAYASPSASASWAAADGAASSSGVIFERGGISLGAFRAAAVPFGLLCLLRFTRFVALFVLRRSSLCC